VPEYKKSEAREWAWEKMKGVANVIIPSFSQDLSRLNERAIRYDVGKEIEFGFWGALLVAETATTLAEYLQFTEWAADEARGRLRLIHHASFNTLEENIRAVQAAEACGAQLVLLSYPANFYARTAQEVYEYTAEFCRATNLGVILFPVPLWGFERIHPAGMPPEMIVRIVDEIPNIVALKAEGGLPTIGGFVDMFHRVGKKVPVIAPLEGDGLPLKMLVEMQFMGTSNYEYYGPIIPRIFSLIQEGKREEAMTLYWQIHPGRMANIAANSISGTNFIHRMVWKFQGWLSGFNGGPLRQPTMRLVDGQMKALRQGLQNSGLTVYDAPLSEFFTGRNPV
jgi:4-hydroxy-tetrahydrodipicolinate synthase